MPEKGDIHNRRRSGRNRLRTVGFCFFLILFLFSSAMAAKSVIEKSKAKNGYFELRELVRQAEYEKAAIAAHADETEQTEEAAELIQRQKIGMDFSPLKEINPDIIGWIRAEGTNIDYPIAQTDNNEYYLSHLYNKDWNGSGTIFADYRNAGDFSDRNTVLYGHRMQNGTMFQALEEYKHQDFYDVNPTMTLFTPDGDYTIELICGTVEDGNDQFVQFDFSTEEAFAQYLESFRSRSSFVSDVELQPGDRIVSLCTCSYEWENARYMVIGRLVPVMETVNERG